MEYIVTLLGRRVVAGRPLAVRTREQASRYCDEFRALFRKLGGRKCVICADYRAVPIFSPEFSEELKRLLQEGNARIERSAILVAPDHATHTLQVGRVVRQAGQSEHRQLFTEPARLERWLAPALDADELAAVAAFLAQGGARQEDRPDPIAARST